MAMVIPSDDHGRAVRRIIIVVPTMEEAPAVVVENRSRRRLLVATTTARRNSGGVPDRDHRQGGPTTTGGPRDGSGRAGEIALMIDQEATNEYPATVEATSNSRGNPNAATATTKKPRGINRSSGGSRSPDVTRRQRRFLRSLIGRATRSVLETWRPRCIALEKLGGDAFARIGGSGRWQRGVDDGLMHLSRSTSRTPLGALRRRALSREYSSWQSLRRL